MDLFEQGFFVRKPAWHLKGVVLADYPGREEAMRLAGHNFNAVELPTLTRGAEGNGDENNYVVLDGVRYGIRVEENYKTLVKSNNEAETRAEDETHGKTLGIVGTDYGVVQNSVPWDIAELLLGEGAQYETGITLDGGKKCAITALLDEPVTITGDDSVILPYLCESWSHDGTAAVRVRSSSVRQVCANTVNLSELEGKRLGTDFTFRHTKNVSAQIEDAKAAIRGVRDNFAAYVELAEELGKQKITPDQRNLFVDTFIPLPADALTSTRVKNNIDRDRVQLTALFDGPTIPDAHRLTAYGLHLAGVEFLDHLRKYRTAESYVNRTLLANNPAKAKLQSLIREVVKS